MSKIFRFSKIDKNSLEDTGANDSIFDSSKNTFKIVKEGILTSQSVTSDPTTFSVAHNRSDIPGVYAFAKFPDGYIATPNEKERADGDPIDRYWLVEVDSSLVYFIFYKGSSSNYSVNIKYYVFETAL